MTYTQDQILLIARATDEFGGSFARAIGKALVVADSYNRQRLTDAFPDLVEKYLKKAENFPQV